MSEDKTTPRTNNTLRPLSIDAVDMATSGHPGTPPPLGFPGLNFAVFHLCALALNSDGLVTV